MSYRDSLMPTKLTQTGDNMRTAEEVQINPQLELNKLKYKSFKQMNPTLIKSLDGYSLFECPIHGDEETLVVVKPDYGIFYTDLFEEPTIPEFENMIAYKEFHDELPAWQGNW